MVGELFETTVGISQAADIIPLARLSSALILPLKRPNSGCMAQIEAEAANDAVVCP